MTMLDMISAIKHTMQSWFPSQKPTPADFRRAHRKVNGVGFSIDRNSIHIGSFQGDIVPMKRRFKGVSRTAHQ